MGAAPQSRPVCVCDNTLSRLPPHEFVQVFSSYCKSIEVICNDYLSRGLEQIRTQALNDFIQKNVHLALNDKDTMVRIGKDFMANLDRFIADVRELQNIVGRMSMIVERNGPASFLMQLSANLICKKILSEMDCTTMMVGGRITTFKEFVGQECWRNRKLNTFFTNLAVDIKKTFGRFNVMSTSQFTLEVQLLEMRLEFLDDPNFGKEEPSPVEMVIKEVLLEIQMENLRALTNKTQNVRGA